MAYIITFNVVKTQSEEKKEKKQSHQTHEFWAHMH